LIHVLVVPKDKILFNKIWKQQIQKGVDMAILQFATQALKNLFLPPVTTSYPASEIQYPEGSRGHVEIDIDNCISCGMCVRSCPSNALAVDRANATWSIDRFDCVACGFCVDKCPKKCLKMVVGYQTPEFEKSVATYKKSEEQLKKEAEAKAAAAAKAAEIAKQKAEAAAKAKAEE
jgi:ech hydrogenase subunit F